MLDKIFVFHQDENSTATISEMEKDRLLNELNQRVANKYSTVVAVKRRLTMPEIDKMCREEAVAESEAKAQSLYSRLLKENGYI